MIAWLKFLLDFVKLLPVIIPLVKQIIDLINGKNLEYKPARGVVREQKRTLKYVARNAAKTGNVGPLAALLDGHLKRAQRR